MIKRGDKRGELTVLRVNGKLITARCSCGKFKTIYLHQLMLVEHPTCGVNCATIKARRDDERARAVSILTDKHVGTRYGSLVITGVDPTTTGRRHCRVTAACDCGKSVGVYLDELTSGQRTSCGCKRLYISPEWRLALYTKWGGSGCEEG